MKFIKNMYLKKLIIIGAAILLIGTTVIPSTISISSNNEDIDIYVDNASPCKPGDGSINCPYVKIQYAIDNATKGDTIQVNSSLTPYKENIIINKTLTLIGEEGENKNYIVIDGSRLGDVVTITANWVNLSGFTICNSGYKANDDTGIYIQCNNSTIRDNNIMDNKFGIYCHNSSNNYFYQNNFVENYQNKNAYDDGTNYWDNGNEGNFWDDYNGEGKYEIPGGNNVDHFPSTAPFGNTPPIQPNPPEGPQQAKTGETLTFSATITDLEDDDVYAKFDWGDGTNSGWLGRNSSTHTFTATHKWLEQGEFAVRVTGKDIWGMEGEMSEPAPLSIPKSKTIQYSSIFSGVFNWFSSIAKVDGAYKLTKDLLPILKDITQFMRSKINDIKATQLNTIVVPRDYSTIQEAIDHANFGDTIRVWDGIYNENIIVDKMVNIIGNSSATTIINGKGNDDVVRTTSDGVLISNFTIKHSDPSGSGIHLASHYNTVKNNNITENYYGLKLYPSTGNIIVRNLITNNNGDGLWLKHSHENTIENNSIRNNGNDGVSANMSSLSNHINFNSIGLNDGDGIVVAETSFGSSFTMNNVSKNTIGFKTTGGSDNNLFHKNNLIKNEQNAYDNSMNSYTFSGKGNYWSDFDDPSEGAWDNDSDGFIDDAYPIPGEGGNQDDSPFASPLTLNFAPWKPARPWGPRQGKTGDTYTFYAVINDPDGDKVKAQFEWTEGILSDWTDEYESGHTFTETHVYFEEGDYAIRVRGQDSQGNIGEWSEPKSFSAPKTKSKIRMNNLQFPDFLENHPCMFPLLRHLLGL